MDAFLRTIKNSRASFEASVLIYLFSGGEFTTIIELPSGVHYFKYLVDGNWIHDPNQVSMTERAAVW